MSYRSIIDVVDLVQERKRSKDGALRNSTRDFSSTVKFNILHWIWKGILFYYINTSEIPSELSRENFIYSHMKITCYRHTWRCHRCYGYITNCSFFTVVYIINRILHARLWIWILSSRGQLDISLVRAYRVDHSKIKFISTRGHVISSIYYQPKKVQRKRKKKSLIQLLVDSLYGDPALS